MKGRGGKSARGRFGDHNECGNLRIARDSTRESARGEKGFDEREKTTRRLAAEPASAAIVSAAAGVYSALPRFMPCLLQSPGRARTSGYLRVIV